MLSIMFCGYFLLLLSIFDFLSFLAFVKNYSCPSRRRLHFAKGCEYVKRLVLKMVDKAVHLIWAICRIGTVCKSTLSCATLQPRHSGSVVFATQAGLNVASIYWPRRLRTSLQHGRYMRLGQRSRRLSPGAKNGHMCHILCAIVSCTVLISYTARISSAFLPP